MTTMWPAAPLAATNFHWITANGTDYPCDVTGGYRVMDGDIAEATAAGFTSVQPDNPASIAEAIAQSVEPDDAAPFDLAP